MSSQTVNALIAIAGGVVIAIVSFVPMAALHYRRAGRFTLADLAALFVVPVYGLALWTYTLLPLPDPNDIVCRPALTDPFHFIGDLRAVWNGSVLDLLRSSTFLQLALNVALFVPLGAILRLRYRRGLLWALVIGFAASLAIETTQLTGVWGLYDCAYRFFDVDDLLTNTTGALLGSLATIPIARVVRAHRHEEPLPTAPTLGRRVVAIVCDLLTMLFVGAVAAITWRSWVVEVRHVAPADVDETRQAIVQWGAAFAVEAVAVLGWGRTIGEAVVRIRTRAARRAWTLPARVIKLACGVGAIAALGAWDSTWASFGLLALAAAMAAAAALTRDHRGLSNLLAGLEVEALGPVTDRDDRDQPTDDHDHSDEPTDAAAADTPNP